MRTIQINKNKILYEDGRLFDIRKNIFVEIHANRHDGYFYIYYDHKMHPMHHLIMKFFGPPKPGPEYEIDHRNQNRLDNDINNLRWVTHRENCYNQKSNRPIGLRVCDLTHKEYKRLTLQEWRLKNKEHNREYQRKYMRKYREEKEKEG